MNVIGSYHHLNSPQTPSNKPTSTRLTPAQRTIPQTEPTKTTSKARVWSTLERTSQEGVLDREEDLEKVELYIQYLKQQKHDQTNKELSQSSSQAQLSQQLNGLAQRSPSGSYSQQQPPTAKQSFEDEKKLENRNCNEDTLPSALPLNKQYSAQSPTFKSVSQSNKDNYNNTGSTVISSSSTAAAGIHIGNAPPSVLKQNYYYTSAIMNSNSNSNTFHPQNTQSALHLQECGNITNDPKQLQHSLRIMSAEIHRLNAKLNKVERSKSTKIVQSSEKKKRYPDNQDQIITATDRNTKEIRSNNSKQTTLKDVAYRSNSSSGNNSSDEISNSDSSSSNSNSSSPSPREQLDNNLERHRSTRNIDDLINRYLRCLSLDAFQLNLFRDTFITEKRLLKLKKKSNYKQLFQKTLKILLLTIESSNNIKQQQQQQQQFGVSQSCRSLFTATSERNNVPPMKLPNKGCYSTAERLTTEQQNMLLHSKSAMNLQANGSMNMDNHPMKRIIPINVPTPQQEQNTNNSIITHPQGDGLLEMRQKVISQHFEPASSSQNQQQQEQQQNSLKQYLIQRGKPLGLISPSGSSSNKIISPGGIQQKHYLADSYSSRTRCFEIRNPNYTLNYYYPNNPNNNNNSISGCLNTTCPVLEQEGQHINHTQNAMANNNNSQYQANSSLQQQHHNYYPIDNTNLPQEQQPHHQGIPPSLAISASTPFLHAGLHYHPKQQPYNEIKNSISPSDGTTSIIQSTDRTHHQYQDYQLDSSRHKEENSYSHHLNTNNSRETFGNNQYNLNNSSNTYNSSQQLRNIVRHNVQLQKDNQTKGKQILQQQPIQIVNYSGYDECKYDINGEVRQPAQYDGKEEIEEENQASWESQQQQQLDPRHKQGHSQRVDRINSQATSNQTTEQIQHRYDSSEDSQSLKEAKQYWGSQSKMESSYNSKDNNMRASYKNAMIITNQKAKTMNEINEFDRVSVISQARSNIGGEGEQTRKSVLQNGSSKQVKKTEQQVVPMCNHIQCKKEGRCIIVGGSKESQSHFFKTKERDQLRIIPDISQIQKRAKPKEVNGQQQQTFDIITNSEQ